MRSFDPSSSVTVPPPDQFPAMPANGPGLRIARRRGERGHKKRGGCKCQPPRMGEEF